MRERNLTYPREAKQDVILVVGFSSTISDKDLELSRGVLEIIKSENPGENHYFTSSIFIKVNVGIFV